MADVTLEINEATPVTLNFSCSPDPITVLQAAVDYLDDAGHIYDSDESAAAGGIAIGSLYLTADNHVAAPGGLLIRRLT
jgi:hypothetical protein